jgi:hypothetical protein
MMWCVIAMTVLQTVWPAYAFGQRFERLPAARSGVTFRNDIVESDTFNVLADFYAYNGGGVAAGDIDNDGDVDLVFSGTQNGLVAYRNDGALSFTDVTDKAGLRVADGDVSTGVLLADLTGDGFLDVYLCRRYRPNRLFVNNGNGTFTDRSDGSPLSIAAYTTHACPIDYDRDGDLDIYVVNGGEPRRQGYINPGSSDMLVRNDGAGSFHDVTSEVGLVDRGYGLSAVVGDLNDDGWPDIWVTNDFEERDRLWINKHGTFADSSAKAMASMSWASMGSDIADLNGDGLLDVVTLDMLPRSYDRLQTQIGGMSIYGPFFDSLQRVHNALQLNRGKARFSNVCYISGIAATDWSWAVLATDLDLDGRNDIFVTNGTKRDLGDQDYTYSLYAGKGTIRTDAYRNMPSSKLADFAFRNAGGFRFEDVSADWGLNEAEVSNGAAYADLDNDGDVEIIVNNTDAVATIYVNRTIDAATPPPSWIGLSLKGPRGNPTAIGARVTLAGPRGTIIREVAAARGFQSTSDTRIVAGLAAIGGLDSVIVRWPTGVVSVHTALAPGRYNEVVLGPDARPWTEPPASPTLLTKLPKASIPFHHRENSYDDFKRERLLPYRFSKDGPGVAVGDVNGDGRTDVVVTGPRYQATECFIQQADGHFVPWPCGIDDVVDAEDVDAVLVDVDNDKDLDLIVVTGGNEFDPEDPELEDRLYRNDGKGRFTRVPGGLPTELASGSRITVADFDADGDADLFIGGRVVPGSFPNASRSVLFRNDRGTFADVTDVLAPGLSTAGMTTDAAWVDVDGDRDLDLVVVGEWMTPRVWRNTKGRFTEVTSELGLADTEGWWQSVQPADVDGDGDMDLIAGNVGLNCRYVPEPGKPLLCHVADFDENGSLDHIVSWDVDGKRKPTRGRMVLTQHIPTLTRSYTTYAQFAAADLEDIIPAPRLDSARVLTVREFASSIFLNEGGRFRRVSLPDMAQIAPILDIVTRDLDADGDLDVVVAGNLKTSDGDIIGMDAGLGLVMLNDGKGALRPLEPEQSGFMAPYEARRMAVIPVRGSSDLLCLTVNGRTPRLFTLPAERSGTRR